MAGSTGVASSDGWPGGPPAGGPPVGAAAGGFGGVFSIDATSERGTTMRLFPWWTTIESPRSSMESAAMVPPLFR